MRLRCRPFHHPPPSLPLTNRSQHSAAQHAGAVAMRGSTAFPWSSSHSMPPTRLPLAQPYSDLTCGAAEAEAARCNAALMHTSLEHQDFQTTLRLPPALWVNWKDERKSAHSRTWLMGCVTDGQAASEWRRAGRKSEWWKPHAVNRRTLNNLAVSRHSIYFVASNKLMSRSEHLYTSKNSSYLCADDDVAVCVCMCIWGAILTSKVGV